MKSNFNLIGIIVLVWIIGFGIISCETDDEPRSKTGNGNENVFYTVSYNANGGSGTTPSSQTVNAGTSITVASQGNLTYSGRIFGGWNTHANGSGTPYAVGSSMTVNASITLYAQWIISGNGNGSGHTHQWDEWVRDIVPTCLMEGSETRICLLDSTHTETRSVAINSDAHDWSNWEITTPATVITDGEENRSCQNVGCSVSESNILPRITSTPGLLFTSIDFGSAFSVSRGTATDTNVIIPATHNGVPVTTISFNAFRESNITSIIIPDSVTSIGINAFFGCSSLTNVTIGNSVTSIGASAFASCTGLSSIVIPNSVTSIGQNAFNFCTSLTSVTIGNSVTSIDNGAFSGCTSLTSIIIPNSVTNISSGAFNGTALINITIPNSVTTIGSNAFSNNNSLMNIIFLNPTPPQIGSSFINDHYNDHLLRIHVPVGSAEAYRTFWGRYLVRIHNIWCTLPNLDWWNWNDYCSCQ